ncbi:MAG: ribosome small subunit-dependent GTPase A [Salinisphaera sp.]|nr:ribosome small subunit-dependent GTPase A [Salinisphaera sp.]
MRAIGWPFPAAPADHPWAELWAALPGSYPARVVEQHRSGYVVADTIDHSLVVESLPEWQRPRLAPDQRPGVGDWLLISGETASMPKAVALLPRHSAIKRAAAGEHYGQQMIAANIDTVFIVSGMDGDFNPRRIERYLLLVRGGAQPVVVLTKADQALDDMAVAAHASALDELAAQGIEICQVNATDPASVGVLQRWLGPGQTVVLVGSSGAGKSTLTNTLLGHERMRTAAVRASDARGRHTTTHRALIALPSGACLIDTPGMRELKPTGEEALSEAGFEDIEALAQRCRFRDCCHVKEPGCAVRAAIEAGEADPERVANYLKLSGEVSGAAARRVAREAPRPGSRKISKAKQKRQDQRFGKE